MESTRKYSHALHVLSLTVAIAAGLAAPAHAQSGPLDVARDLYASARYDEALAMLNGVRQQESGNPTISGRSSSTGRSACSRSGAAPKRKRRLPWSWPPIRCTSRPRPKRRLACGRRSPKCVSASCPTSRAPAMPRRRPSFDRKDYPVRRTAVPRTAPPDRRPGYGRTSGRSAHARDGLCRPERRRRGAAPRPSRNPKPRREEAAPPAPAPAVPDAADACTRPTTRACTPATPIRQEVPRVPMQIANQTRERGILDVTIDEQGRVISAAIRVGLHPIYDSQMLAGGQRMALSAGDAERPAREVPQDHPDHRLEALIGAPARSAGSLRIPEGGTLHCPASRWTEDSSGSSPAAVALVAAALLASACGRPRDTPAPPPVRADIVLPLETQTIEAVVPRQATLETLLRQHELPAALVQAAIESTRRGVRPAPPAGRPPLPTRPLRRRAAERVRIPDRRRSLPPHRQSRSFGAGEARRRGPALRQGHERRRRSAAGSTASILAHCRRRRGGRAGAAGDLAGRALQRPDRFRERPAAGRLVRSAVRDDARTRRVRRIRRDPRRALHQRRQANTRPIAGCIPGTQKAGYYDEQGRSLRRFVLASPLRFTPRVTSGFSRRRLHPVFRTVRAHLGVDYAAPTGTPVVAVASGVVVSAGWAGGGGRQVRIRHASGFESYYLHLSAFAQGRPRRRARRAGPVDRPRRRDRHGDGAAPRLPPPKERRVRRSAARACAAAAGRTDPGAVPRRRSAPRATTCCSSLSTTLAAEPPPQPTRPRTSSKRRQPTAVHLDSELELADGVPPSVPGPAAGAVGRGDRVLRSLRRREHRRSAAARRRQPAQLSSRDAFRDRSAARHRSLFDAASTSWRARTSRRCARRRRSSSRTRRRSTSTGCAWARTSRPASPAASRSTSTSRTSSRSTSGRGATRKTIARGTSSSCARRPAWCS